MDGAMISLVQAKTLERSLLVPRTPKNNAWLIAEKRQMQLAVSLSLDKGAGFTLKMLVQAAGIHHINALCFQNR